jgi:putative ABC transport system permease protein
MLLIPAGLLTRALWAAHTLDPGFDHRNVAVVGIDLGPRFQKDTIESFREQWLERIRALPDVERVALANRIPLSPGRSQTTLRLGDEPEGRVVDVNTVSPEFFSVLAIPIVRGRVFTDGEVDVALVTESTAQRYWPGQDGIGRTVIVDGRRRHIVGIARDAQLSQAQDAVASYLYLPARQGLQRGISVLARTRTNVEAFAAAVRAETSRMDAGLVVNVQPLSNNLAILQTLSQVTASVAGILSLLALGLAAVGIYGVVAYAVTRRRREVGIRMALGASVRDVRRLILGQTMRPVAAGMTIGLAVAAAVARVLHSVLFGVSPFDPVAYLAAPLVMIAVAALATWLPTRQALQTDPVTTLRSE